MSNNRVPERTRRPNLIPVMIAVLSAFALLSVGIILGSRMGIPFLDREIVWSIGVFEGPSPLQMSPSTRAQNPVLAPGDVDDVEAAFVADPFVVPTDSALFMFFEVLNRSTNQGDIAVAVSRDGFDWDYQRVVVDEPFHLSYPQVFQWEGDFFMIPESEQDLSVRLYRATHFPDQWAWVGNLLEGRHFLDPTVFRHDDAWWMFVSFLGNDILALYRAEDLSGPWEEHPSSPVVRGNPNLARPGGRVAETGIGLLRFGQDDSPSYGNQLFALDISVLTDTEYGEALASTQPVLSGSGTGWNAKGMHHLDLHFLQDRWVGFVDGRTVKTTFHWPF